MALEVQAAQLKLLRQTSEREKKELQKILERRRHRSITEARGRGGRRQTELTEINRRHITESVTSIRRLEEAQQRRQEKLLEGHRGILQQIQDEEPRLAQELERGWELPPDFGGGGLGNGAPPQPGTTPQTDTEDFTVL